MSAMKGAAVKARGTASPGYEVGYCRAPVEHRFKPGQSGNPRGRPRRPKRSPYEEQLKGIVGEELYREITVREGEHASRLPMMQAIIRCAAHKAAKGDVRAQKLVADLVRWTKTGQLKSKLEALEGAIRYKEEWGKELARRERLGVVADDPVPHPDHIKIDWNKAEIELTGPMTPEEKMAYDNLMARSKAYEEEIACFEQLLLEAPNDTEARAHLNAINARKERIDKILSEVGWFRK
jgi:hypothetical protein